MRTMKERQPMDGLTCIRRRKIHGTEYEVKIYIINNLREIKKTIRNMKQEKIKNQFNF